MEVSVSIKIEKSIEEVWNAITDFKNCKNYITSIINLEIIENPKDTLLGFKWKETREDVWQGINRNHVDY